MKPSLLSLILLLSVAVLCRAEEIPLKKMTPDDFITAYENALATQDWSEVDPLVHPDYTVTFSDGTLHMGSKTAD